MFVIPFQAGVVYQGVLQARHAFGEQLDAYGAPYFQFECVYNKNAYSTSIVDR